MVPSERVIVPSIDWLTPLPACGAPLTVTGGHAAAHAPEHMDVLPLSASNRYRVRPWLSTRALPGIPEMACRLIVVAAALLACEADDDTGPAAVLLLLEPLEQAVAARTIPAAHAAPAIQFFMVILPRDTVRGVHGRPPQMPNSPYRRARIEAWFGSMRLPNAGMWSSARCRLVPFLLWVRFVVRGG